MRNCDFFIIINKYLENFKNKIQANMLHCKSYNARKSIIKRMLKI